MSDSKPTTQAGEALRIFGDNLELLEQAYQQSGGEVDEGTEAIEHFADLAADEALESLARFLSWVASVEGHVASERERLADTSARMSKRREWAESQILRVLNALEKKSRTVASFRFSTRKGSERVEVDPKRFNPDEAPDEIIRIKPAVAEKRELNKSAYRKWAKRDDALPIDGVEIVRGPTTVKVD